MTEITVNTDILHSPSAKEYFTRADGRIMAGLRLTLEMLGIGLPDYARRKPAGRPPSKAINAAFGRDHAGGNGGISRPDTAVPTHADREAYLAERKLAKFQARIAKRKAGDLFSETFGSSQPKPTGS
jgi:hypothetical protein